ncbi:fungal-specific transcription factor domain-containing protein [Mariannaea sp. PMI_226]|nr:fungal-specific transcription factor domain-containing protein [Mariannaea sp. PMI_226]
MKVRELPVEQAERGAPSLVGPNRHAGTQDYGSPVSAVNVGKSSYIENLKRRITWLESIVRTRCPDVDLSLDISPGDLDQDLFDETVDTTINLAESPSLVAINRESPPGINGSLSETPQQPVRSGPGPLSGDAGALTHEIGLVSLVSNQDARYIGPSSGYFLARVMLDSSRLDDAVGRPRPNHNAPFPTQLVEAVQAPLPLPPRDMANQLCSAYFDVIHLQYPILHEPTFFKMLEQAYSQEEMDPVVGFQVFMVLALGATALSARLSARIPGEPYCLSALKYYTSLNLENSIQGVQCLLLLLLFTIHNPYVRLNVWYLNYHCLAALLDLGLQRDINIRSGISLLEQEMRTRIFWVIFTFDRIIATMMGRPIGLRDEACELRMPQGLSDDELLIPGTSQLGSQTGSKQMQFAMHLFRASKLNSEIKYVANSINRSAPSYAYPPIRDINSWQADMLRQLDDWADQIPVSVNDAYLRTTCQIRYHGLRMLLLRPSPAIPKPSSEALSQCHRSACETLRLFDYLYSADLLVHSWLTFHSLVLSTITMLFCIKVVPEIARKTDINVLMGYLSGSLSVLSATGEHWSGAKRSRNILEKLGRSTILWLRQLSSNDSRQNAQSAVDTTTHNRTQTPLASNVAMASTLGADPEASRLSSEGNAGGFMQSLGEEFLAHDSFADYFESSEYFDVDALVRDLFQDFIPIYPSFT